MPGGGGDGKSREERGLRSEHLYIIKIPLLFTILLRDAVGFLWS